jgi:purine-binding chemotaxis protein CheW
MAEDARRVLEERARALARPPAPPPKQDTVELLTFALASETYAVESRFVIQVSRLSELSPLPGAQPPVFGLTPWRGGLLTILDLRQVLGVPATALNDLGRVIVLGDERPAFGILADAVHDLVSVPSAAIRAPQDGVATSREFLRGVTGEAVLVLEAEALLRSHLSKRQGG